MQFETAKNGGPADLIRVGGINIEAADRDSNNSGRGSEADIKAI